MNNPKKLKAQFTYGNCDFELVIEEKITGMLSRLLPWSVKAHFEEAARVLAERLKSQIPEGNTLIIDMGVID